MIKSNSTRALVPIRVDRSAVVDPPRSTSVDASILYVLPMSPSVLWYRQVSASKRVFPMPRLPDNSAYNILTRRGSRKSSVHLHCHRLALQDLKNVISSYSVSLLLARSEGNLLLLRWERPVAADMERLRYRI